MTREDVRHRISRMADPPRTLGLRGDHDLNPGMGAPAAPRDAAVLVPLVERAGALAVLLTLRTAHLAAHAGQISFPGGCVEPGDRDAEATALRETEEEIGLPAERVELVGRLDTYLTRTGFRITPVVGLVRAPFVLRPDPSEVADIFEMPLDVVLDPANPQRHGREFQGRERYFYVYPYEDRYIWGATAGMLKNLGDLLREAV